MSNWDEIKAELLQLRIDASDPRYKDHQEGLVLIGSRAMTFWNVGGSRIVNIPETDWDMIGTIDMTLQWLERCRTHVTQLTLKRLQPTTNGKAENVESKDGKSAITVFHKLLGQGKGFTFEVELITPETYESSSGRLLRRQCALDEVYSVLLPGQPLGGKSSKSEAIVANCGALEVIKHSHILWPKNWWKHMCDMHDLRAALMANDYERDKDLEDIFAIRRQEHLTLYGGDPAQHINLNQTNEDFLDKFPLTVRRHLKHDDIHVAVMYGDKPIYTKMKPDTKEGQSKAKCEQKLFEALSTEDKLNSIREECMVIALERYLLPGRTRDVDDAYKQALERVCTSLTKGWFREYAINHWPKLRALGKDKDLSALQKKVHSICESRQGALDKLLRDPIQRVELLADRWFSSLFGLKAKDTGYYDSQATEQKEHKHERECIDKLKLLAAMVKTTKHHYSLPLIAKPEALSLVPQNYLMFWTEVSTRREESGDCSQYVYTTSSLYIHRYAASQLAYWSDGTPMDPTPVLTVQFREDEGNSFGYNGLVVTAPVSGLRKLAKASKELKISKLQLVKFLVLFTKPHMGTVSMDMVEYLFYKATGKRSADQIHPWVIFWDTVKDVTRREVSFDENEDSARRGSWEFSREKR